MTRHPESAAPDERTLVVAERVARVMDGFFLDPLLGLFLPGVGDLVGAALGLYPVWLAWRRGAPSSLIARMLLNLSVDMLTGAVPVVGDIWDFFFRANTRNLALLRERWTASGQVRSSPRDALIVAGAAAAFVLALAAPVLLVVVVMRALLR